MDPPLHEIDPEGIDGRDQGDFLQRLTLEPLNNSKVFWDFEKIPRFFIPRFF